MSFLEFERQRMQRRDRNEKRQGAAEDVFGVNAKNIFGEKLYPIKQPPLDLPLKP